MGKLPWAKFFWGDWKSDAELQAASAATRGAWINILCQMWSQDPVTGTITARHEHMRKMAGCETSEWDDVLRELDELKIARVTVRDFDVTLVCRRMEREHKSKHSHKLRQEEYRKRHAGDASVTGERSEDRGQRSEDRKKKTSSAEPKDTWLTPYIKAFQEITGGIVPAGKLARPMKALEGAHAKAVVLESWKAYLKAAQAKGELKYVSPARFAQTFGDWHQKPKHKPLPGDYWEREKVLRKMQEEADAAAAAKKA